MELKPGIIFSEHYKLIEQIGVGGFSEVWKASDIRNPSLEIALKIYSVLDKNGEAQFSHEYSDVFKINHQNLLTAKSYDSWNGSPYLVFPFCEKGSLEKMMRNKSTLKKAEIQGVLLDVVSGLSYLHKKGIVHRDMKPANILENDDGEWVISDFGISVKTKTTLRKSTMRLGTSGTIAYMSPESLKGGFLVDTATDIFSIGVMIFEMAYGFEPWGGLGGNALMENTPLPELPSEFGEEWNLLMQSCLQYQPTKRPTATMILDYLNGKSGIDVILKQSELTKVLNTIKIEKTEKKAKNIESAPPTIEIEVNAKLDDNQTPIDKKSKSLLPLFIILISVIILLLLFFYKKDTVYNYIYPDLKIGEQIWMQRNLDVDYFSNGELIPEAKTIDEWKSASEHNQPAWCNYDNDPANGEKYGKLYNWYAVNDSRGLAPEGWHIPNNSEWTSLIANIMETDKDGIRMKSYFDSLPGGTRGHNGVFGTLENMSGSSSSCSLDKVSFWWVKNEDFKENALVYNLIWDGVFRSVSDVNKGSGLSIRCIKD